MAETTTAAVYELPENPVYHEDIPKLTQDDSIDADEVVNPLIQKILENAHAVKKELTDHNTSETAHADLFGSIFPYVLPEGFGDFLLKSAGDAWLVFARDDDFQILVQNGAEYGKLDLSTNNVGLELESDECGFSSVILNPGSIMLGSDRIEISTGNSAIVLEDNKIYINGNVEIPGSLDMTNGMIKNLPEPTEPGDAATLATVVDNAEGAVNSKLPKVFTVTIPATNTGVTGSVSHTFPSCTANETDCIADAAPAAASWDAFYGCNFRLKTISPTGFTYTVDSNLTSPMTVYITVQDIRPLDTVPEGGA